MKWSIAYPVLLIATFSFVFYLALVRPLGPLTTYLVTCQNGTATVQARTYSRTKAGSPYFRHINGVRQTDLSFPPDCFVAVQP